MSYTIKFLLMIMTVVVIMSGCATPGPPVQLLKNHDHAALVKWYEQKAATLRNEAEEMRAMARVADNYDERGLYTDKLGLMAHCRDLAEGYSKSAEKAEELAQMHRILSKGKNAQ
ncbi:hypothetical protein [Nitrosomonas mobilis]|uniref:Lipoprotein n=1 Tax=Nitrosomonas mobilis TaxID=51642 RepID=A0A1G5SCA2_9PROT|nr:hypothetical protein [Nitrosomonas mobilis]SCZ84826.1 exported hypothetical protein [Nitrosomonas mobilis]HNO75636.1 hypothetical protein [Nitrosomonas mobilis]